METVRQFQAKRTIITKKKKKKVHASNKRKEEMKIKTLRTRREKVHGNTNTN